MSCPFVLIHIGDHFPEYTNTCIQQVLRWNPTSTLYCLMSECHKEKILDKKVNFISLESIPLSPKRASFSKRCPVEGFWKVTTERFFVLEDFMNQYTIKECFHLENDNLIYFSMEEMLPLLRKTSKGISAPYLGSGHIGFGVCYFKGLSFLEEMTTFFMCRPVNGNDMTNGYAFFAENRHITSCLPTCSELFDIAEEEIDFITEGSEHFRHFWDALAYGQFIGGNNPRCHMYIPHYVNTDCAFLTSQFKYSWSINSDGLRIPQVERHGNSWLLYNIHVHSKDLDDFVS
jgi:hypothetical protein